MRRRRAYVKEGGEGENNNHNKKSDERDGWLTSTFENALLDKFYKNNIVPSSEWVTFIGMLRHPLNTAVRLCPTTFFSSSKDNKNQQQQEQLLNHFTNTLLQQLKNTFTGEDQKVRLLNFVPSAIDFSLPRGALKKKSHQQENTTAAVGDGEQASSSTTTTAVTNRHAKAALNALSDHGLLSRQEVVSMVPPALLDVQPGHRVLDMCAAPGSKTMQMLEKLVQNGSGSGDKGFVVANDVNAGRLDVLQKQIGRNHHASAHLIVTNFDARLFPTPLTKNPEYEEYLLRQKEQQQQPVNQDDATTTSTATTKPPLPFIPARFDRVLCDAMCSGDGTLRKSADLWERWKPNNSLSLHNSQKNVLFRGMQLCKQGGIIVYSTCSMHPAEDEAVVAAAMKLAVEGGGQFELMDPREKLPNLNFCPGQRDWKIMTQDGNWVDEDAFMKYHQQSKEQQQQQKDNDNNNNSNETQPSSPSFHPILLPSMFPSFAAKDTPNLEYCCRVLPHQQDTGGFFIAAMKCVKEMPASAQNLRTLAHNKANDGTTNNNNNNKNNKNKNSHGRSKEDECFVPINDDIKKEIQSILHLPSDFPFHRLYCRQKLAREPKLYYVAEDAASSSSSEGIITQIGQSGSGKNLERVVSVGVRVIESVSKFSFRASRFAAEGAAVLAQHLPSCMIHDVDGKEVLKTLEENISNNKNNSNSNNTPQPFPTMIRVKMPSGFRTEANEYVRVEREKRQQQQQQENASSSTTASYPEPLKQIIVRIHLGPNISNNDNNNDDRILIVPGEIDSMNYVTLRVQRTAANLIRYSYDGFRGVMLEEVAGDNRKSNNKNGDDDDNDDDDNDEAEDKNADCCDDNNNVGPAVPPKSN